MTIEKYADGIAFFNDEDNEIAFYSSVINKITYYPNKYSNCKESGCISIPYDDECFILKTIEENMKNE